MTLFNLQEREEARKQLEAVRSETGDDPNVNYYLGRLDLMEGKVDSALLNLTLAASKPPFPDVAYYHGYAYLKKGNFDSAEKWLEKAAALAPRDARVEQRLGLLYRAMGRQEESEKAFALSSELHQQDVVATEQALAWIPSRSPRPGKPAKSSSILTTSASSSASACSMVSTATMLRRSNPCASRPRPTQIPTRCSTTWASPTSGSSAPSRSR